MLDMRDVLEIGLADSMATLTQRVVHCAEKMGFGLASGVMIRGRFGSPTAAHYAFANPPAGYFDAMNSVSDGLRDPLLAKLMEKQGQVQYDQSLYTDTGAGDLWDAQAPFGFKSGMAVSIHQYSHEEAFLLGLDGPDRLPQGTALFQLTAHLQLLAVYAQAATSKIVATQQGVVRSAELNKAEVEAVRTVGATVYARRGHLTAISRVGAPALQSAARKLGARSATETVLRAIEGGLLHP